MAADDFRKYEPFFGKWKLARQDEIGKGAFGDVYEIFWEDDLGGRSVSALKVMHIPKEEALRTQIEVQPNMEAVRSYFSRQVDRIKDEIRILQKCKGHSNIVSYEDHLIIENGGESGIGWDILIRMELLYPITPEYLSEKNASQYDIIRMWSDIANALIFCDEMNIIHRDIKPANILVSKNGNYKLTDFGVAREVLEKDALASTRVGTEVYMAPEVFDRRNHRYDKRADYYSLGRVIYFYLNNNRHAFLPSKPVEVTSEDMERAEQMRLRGDRIPKIDGVSKEINALLDKSLSFRPSGRPKNAQELYNAIRKILDKQGEELKKKPINGGNSTSGTSVAGTKGKSKNSSRVKDKTASKNRISVKSGITSSESVHAARERKASEGKRGQMTVPLTIAAVFLVTGVSILVYSLYSGNDQSRMTAYFSSMNSNGKGTGNLTEIETESETEALVEVIVLAETEEITEALAETVFEAEETTEELTEVIVLPEPETEETMEASTETEFEAEKQTEEPTEVIVLPEPETEEITEAPTETEEITEAPTETEPETEETTEAPAETETERPLPTARFYGILTAPDDGDAVQTEFRLKEVVLINDTVSDFTVYADIMSGSECVYSEAMELSELSEKTLNSDTKKYSSEIVVANGFEVKDTISVEDLPAGNYVLNIRVTDNENGEEEILNSVSITLEDNGTESSGGGLIADWGLENVNEETEEASMQYLFEEEGYAIGLDIDNAENAGSIESESTENTGNAITANPEQVLLTGWINAPEGTSIGVICQIDSVDYSADMIAEEGGSVTIVRTRRNLELMDAGLIGENVQDMENAGYIISLDLSFLEEGDHTISLTFNVGLPEKEAQLIDFQTFTVTTDSSIQADEEASQKIMDAWAAEFPEEETEELQDAEDPREKSEELQDVKPEETTSE